MSAKCPRVSASVRGCRGDCRVSAPKSVRAAEKVGIEEALCPRSVRAAVSSNRNEGFVRGQVSAKCPRVGNSKVEVM